MFVAIDGHRGLIDGFYIVQFLGLARTKEWLSPPSFGRLQCFSGGLQLEELVHLRTDLHIVNASRK
jgi:hypothetical protein